MRNEGRPAATRSSIRSRAWSNVTGASGRPHTQTGSSAGNGIGRSLRAARFVVGPAAGRGGPRLVPFHQPNLVLPFTRRPAEISACRKNRPDPQLRTLVGTRGDFPGVAATDSAPRVPPPNREFTYAAGSRGGRFL